MFTGREYFPELGIYDYRNRFYYPTLGRFLQTDPTGFAAGDINLFRYCGGDPVNLSDPLGLDVVVTLQEATGVARGFDHIGLGVNTTATQGFYGSNSFNGQGMIGIVKSDSPTSDEILGSITITTTPVQDAIIAGVFSQFNGTQYAFFDRNCATAVAAALQAAGLKFDKSDIPYRLFLNLVKAYPPGHGSRVTYPNGAKGGQSSGGGGGESTSGGNSSGVSVIPSIQIGGYYNVDPNSDFFSNLMAAYPNATVVQQSGAYGGGKSVPIFLLF
jgi:RHS repeat-associated protein